MTKLNLITIAAGICLAPMAWAQNIGQEFQSSSCRGYSTVIATNKFELSIMGVARPMPQSTCLGEQRVAIISMLANKDGVIQMADQGFVEFYSDSVGKMVRCAYDVSQGIQIPSDVLKYSGILVDSSSSWTEQQVQELYREVEPIVRITCEPLSS
jgi:hypothetical protein